MIGRLTRVLVALLAVAVGAAGIYAVGARQASPYCEGKVLIFGDGVDPIEIGKVAGRIAICTLTIVHDGERCDAAGKKQLLRQEK